jgi:prepilin-type N-terminal cleavage/methylation domain-containing protein
LPARRFSGFSLIEVLVAVTILAMTFLVIWRTFLATINGWERGSKFLERLHTGDYVIEQVVSALRSAAFFTSKPGVYGFIMEKHGGEYPSDEFCWVTGSSAFLPPDSPHANGLHRIALMIGDAPGSGGENGLLVKAWPHLADLNETEPEEWFISSKVKGIRCEPYNFDEKDWDTEWEDTNTIPRLVKITVYLEPQDRFGEAVKLSRLVEIPMAELATNSAMVAQLQQGQTGTGEGQTPTQQQPQPAEGAQVQTGQEAVTP